jgi:hypothetical protein
METPEARWEADLGDEYKRPKPGYEYIRP